MTDVKTLPSLPYYAVILTVDLSDQNEGYAQMTTQMIEMAKDQPGFLGIESAETSIGIIISYWDSLDSIQLWNRNAFHQVAKSLGKSKWYKSFRTRICKVEFEYGS